jgi:hypothetical protein
MMIVLSKDPEFYSIIHLQEVDGYAALLMHRNDVLDGMGLKLGKAIHIYNYLKKFQLAQAYK